MKFDKWNLILGSPPNMIRLQSSKLVPSDSPYLPCHQMPNFLAVSTHANYVMMSMAVHQLQASASSSDWWTSHNSLRFPRWSPPNSCFGFQTYQTSSVSGTHPTMIWFDELGKQIILTSPYPYEQAIDVSFWLNLSPLRSLRRSSLRSCFTFPTHQASSDFSTYATVI